VLIVDGWHELRADLADLFSKGGNRPKTVRVGTGDERRDMIRSDHLEMSER
jgi:hypothetical protein